MVIKLTCPNGHKLAAKESKAGKMATCPACGAAIQIPMPTLSNSSDSAVLRNLGLDQELRRAKSAMEDSMLRSSLKPTEFQGAAVDQKKQKRSTQICPQCGWEIDAGYRVCPHCRYYLTGKDE